MKATCGLCTILSPFLRISFPLNKKLKTKEGICSQGSCNKKLKIKKKIKKKQNHHQEHLLAFHILVESAWPLHWDRDAKATPGKKETLPWKSRLPSSWAIPPEAWLLNDPNAGPTLPEHKPQYVHEAFQYMWNRCINNSLLALNEKHTSLNLRSWIGSRSYVIPGWKGYSCKHAWWLEAV